MESRWNSGRSSAVGGCFTTKVKEADNVKEACEGSRGGAEIQPHFKQLCRVKRYSSIKIKSDGTIRKESKIAPDRNRKKERCTLQGLWP